MRAGVLSAIGNTPLVRLDRVFKNSRFRLFAKLEMLNPGGSMKDRSAASIIEHAIAAGTIDQGTVVIESSSGNMGVGLAQSCAYFGLRFICVLDPKATLQNIRLLEAYGAEVDLVLKPDPNTGEFLKARIDRVKYLLNSIEHSFWPNQYANQDNPIAHHQTMDEIVKSLGEVDYLFCATSTCGTMRGCAEYISKHRLRTRVCAVDAVGSVIFGGKNAKRLIPGHGAAVRPQLYQPGLADEVIRVTDLDCILGCRRLVKHEALLAGGSSGGVVMAVAYANHTIPDGSNCVIILADRGERYLDTIYSNTWVMEHFGEISQYLQDIDNGLPIDIGQKELVGGYI